MPKRRLSKVPGTPSGPVTVERDGEQVEIRKATDHRIPLCSHHKTPTVRNVNGEWVCLECADQWLKDTVRWASQGKSVGGVELPVGVRDQRQERASFRDAFPNHKARRRARKRG